MLSSSKIINHKGPLYSKVERGFNDFQRSYRTENQQPRISRQNIAKDRERRERRRGIQCFLGFPSQKNKNKLCTAKNFV
jgi:hypothetical protein